LFHREWRFSLFGKNKAGVPDRLQLSAQGFPWLLKLVGTIADLSGSINPIWNLNHQGN